jgi:hypothetical protein
MITVDMSVQGIAEDTRDEVAEAADTAERYAEERVVDSEPNSIVGKAAQTATVIAVVAAGVAGLIGIFIFAQVSDALPSITNSNLSSSKDSLVGGFGDAMELLPVVLIVLLAALVIGVVQRMRS